MTDKQRSMNRLPFQIEYGGIILYKKASKIFFYEPFKETVVLLLKTIAKPAFYKAANKST